MAQNDLQVLDTLQEQIDRRDCQQDTEQIYNLAVLLSKEFVFAKDFSQDRRTIYFKITNAITAIALSQSREIDTYIASALFNLLILISRREDKYTLHYPFQPEIKRKTPSLSYVLASISHTLFVAFPESDLGLSFLAEATFKELTVTLAKNGYKPLAILEESIRREQTNN